MFGMPVSFGLFVCLTWSFGEEEEVEVFYFVVFFGGGVFLFICLID